MQENEIDLIYLLLNTTKERNERILAEGKALSIFGAPRGDWSACGCFADKDLSGGKTTSLKPWDWYINGGRLPDNPRGADGS